MPRAGKASVKETKALLEEQHPTEEVVELPVIALRRTVVFPRTVVPIQVGRVKSLRAVENAMEGRRLAFMVAQRDHTAEPSPDALFSIGTVALIGQVLRLPDESSQVWVQGQWRAEALDYPQSEPHLRARVRRLKESFQPSLELEALVRLVQGQFETYAQLSKSAPEEALVAVKNIDEPGWLADLVAFSVDFEFEERQRLLEVLDPAERLRRLSLLLGHQVEILELKSKIETEVHKGFEKTQRDYQLREQLKAIQRELGETDPEQAVINQLRQKVEEAGMPEAAREKALHEVERLGHIPFASPETAVIRTYVDWLVSLPWSIQTEDRLDLQEAAKVLDEDHYGLKRVKERILEYMAVRKLAQERMRSPILCFVGPPGVGKTSLGRSIARALGRKFVRISLGGIRDEAEIRGHRRTYVGALPGRIIQGMKNAASRNPVFMLDELDKVGVDFRGDPSAALLEVLDPEQNHAFSDHYLEVPFDLSKVIFIATANVLYTVPPALRDRLEVIELPGYTEEEKVRIAQQFLVPRQLERHGLDGSQLRFSEGALRGIIREYTKEAGVRNLEREVASICRKVARRLAEGRGRRGGVRATDLAEFLGPPRFTYGTAEERDEIGVATGVAVTEAGGDLLAVEVNVMEGKGDLIVTGQLGEVMQESARAAVSYARSRAADFGLEGNFFDKRTIHIHVPAGAIPKDGPSAGITMATALISALSGRPVRREAAMTGEITLRGRVLPVGGLKEKLLAAHRAGIRTFIMPEKNRKDLAEVPPRLLRGLKLVFVENMEQVLEAALLPPSQQAAA